MMSKVNSELLDLQLKAEAPVAEASCPVSVVLFLSRSTRRIETPRLPLAEVALTHVPT